MPLRRQALRLFAAVVLSQAISGGAPPEIAYRAVFGCLALILLAGLLLYSRARDSKPLGERVSASGRRA